MKIICLSICQCLLRYIVTASPLFGDELSKKRYEYQHHGQDDVREESGAVSLHGSAQFQFFLNKHHIECSSKRNQWYLNHFISTFGELLFSHQPGMMVHQWTGHGLQTAVLLLINHNFRQLTIITLDLGCLVKSLDMILIAMGNDTRYRCVL